MKDKTALTARQKRFVEEYLACGDGPEAAIAAGYSPATAEERARPGGTALPPRERAAAF